MEGGLAKSTSVGEGGVARERGLCTYLDEEVAKIVREKLALARGLAEIGPQNKSEAGCL